MADGKRREFINITVRFQLHQLCRAYLALGELFKCKPLQALVVVGIRKAVWIIPCGQRCELFRDRSKNTRFPVLNECGPVLVGGGIFIHIRVCQRCEEKEHVRASHKGKESPNSVGMEKCALGKPGHHALSTAITVSQCVKYSMPQADQFLKSGLQL